MNRKKATSRSLVEDGPRGYLSSFPVYMDAFYTANDERKRKPFSFGAISSAGGSL